MPDIQDAISMLEKGDAHGASALLEAMAEEMPGYATARVLLARAYEGLEEWPSALDAWRDALQIVPNSPVIRRGLERAARRAASRPSVEELPSVSVSEPDVVAEFEPTEVPEPAPIERREEPAGESAADELAGDEPAGDEPAADEPEADEPAKRSIAENLPAPKAPAEESIPEGGSGPHEKAEGLPAVGSAPPDVRAEAAKLEAEVQDRFAADPAEQAEPDFSPADQEGSLADETAAPEVPPPPREDDEDLDRLIAELESARIVPRPDFDHMPDYDLEDDIEDVVSVTLARIYASQGQYEEAARVYDLLAEQQPESEAEFKSMAAEMRSKASE